MNKAKKIEVLKTVMLDFSEDDFRKRCGCGGSTCDGIRKGTLSDESVDRIFDTAKAAYC
jgi:hypothetical protein